MTTRKRALTAQIKPETRNAIMDQLACAADTIIGLRAEAEVLQDEYGGLARDWLALKDRRLAGQFWLAGAMIVAGVVGIAVLLVTT